MNKFEMTVFIYSPHHAEFGREFDLEITKIIWGAIGELDFKIIRENIIKHFSPNGLPKDEKIKLLATEFVFTRVKIHTYYTIEIIKESTCKNTYAV